MSYRQKRPIPQVNRATDDDDGGADEYAIERIRVGSRTPEHAGEPAPHVYVRIGTGAASAPLAFRFVDPVDIDEVIELLRWHRANAWPDYRESST